MPKIVVEGPDGRKFAFPDTMPRAEINAFMKQKYGTKARDESVQDYLARFGREQAATEARAKDIDREATAAGRAEGERAAERMGVDNPFLMAFAAPAIGLAQQEGGRRVFDREGTVLADEAAGLAAANSAGFFVPGLVNPQFGARVEEGRRQQPLAAFAGDIAGGYGPGEIIGAGVAKAAQAIGPSMAAVGRMFSRGPGPNATNAIAGGTLGGIAPAETAEERARNIALGVGLGAVARPASQMVDDLTRTGAPRAMPDAMPAGAGDNPYFGRQSMRPPGSGPSPREIETQQQWATATPIVTQARTTAQSAQQAADAALQSKAPADIARAKDQKKTLVGQLQEAQASRAGMDTPEDARLAETLASLTENTSDPVLLSTQISAAKTSLDRLLTDIGSPVEGNLIPVKTNILTRTQAPRSAAEGPQDRASVTRYAEGSDDVQPMGFFNRPPRQALGKGLQDIMNDVPAEKPKVPAPASKIENDILSVAMSAPSLGVRGAPGQGRGPMDFRPIRGVREQLKALGYSDDELETALKKMYREGKVNLSINDDQGSLTDADRAASFVMGQTRIDLIAPTGAQPPIKGMGFGAGTPKTPEQAVRFETPGSPEYEAAVAKGLDMSQAGRMARAKEMGFDTETVYFHGTPDARGVRNAGQFEQRKQDTSFLSDPDRYDAIAKEMADERAANGVSDRYMKLLREANELNVTSESPRPIYMTNSEGTARTYARDDRAFNYQGAEPDVMPLMTRGDMLKLDARGAKFSMLPVDVIRAGVPAGRRADFDAIVRRYQRDFTGNGGRMSTNDLEAIAHQMGFDGFEVRNVIDDYMGKGGKSTVRAIFDPSNIRSVNAAFDPEKSGSSTLLAAAPFAAVGGAGLTSERELGSKMTRDKKD
jgi:hypothetical protein